MKDDQPAARRVAIYVRISKDPTGQGRSIDGQEADCRALCERRGWDVVGVFRDNDTSAYSGKPRPGYRDLMKAVSERRCDVVVAWHTDRLHRNLRELSTYLDTCEKAAVTTATVAGGDWDVSTADGRMQAQILGALAERESRHRSERVKAGRRRVAAAGKPSGGTRPFGWDKDGVTERPAEVEAVKWGTKELIRGGSLRDVARDWNTRGLLTDSGSARVFGPNGVRAILSRPRNAGMVTHRGEVVRDVKAVWKPLVPFSEWNAVRQILRDPDRRSSPGNKPQHLGSFLYRCGTLLPDGSLCDEQLRAAARSTYKCPTAGESKHGIPHVTIHRDETDEHVVGFVLGLLEEQRYDFASDPGATDTGSGVSVDDIAANERVLLDLFERGLLSVGVLEERLSEYASLRDELESAEVDGVRAGGALGDLRELMRSPRETWSEMTLDRRRAFLHDYVSVTVWSVGEVRSQTGARGRSGKYVPVGDRVRAWVDVSGWTGTTDETVSSDVDPADMMQGETLLEHMDRVTHSR